MFHRFGAIAAAALVLAAPLPARPGGQTGASRFVLAQVTDPRGRAFVDVSADDFVIQEGVSSREVLDVRVADYPVAILIDDGAAAAGDFAPIKAAVLRMVERIGPRPLAIVTMGGEPRAIASFDDDRATLLARLASVESPTAEPGRPLRAAARAARAIQATGALFSAIVMATASPVDDSGPAAEEWIAPIVDSRAVVHVVADDRRAADRSPVLRGLARQTHGQYTPIYTAASYMPAMERLAARLTTELMVEYIVPVGSRATDPKIGVRIPGARVLGLGVAPR